MRKYIYVSVIAFFLLIAVISGVMIYDYYKKADILTPIYIAMSIVAAIILYVYKENYKKKDLPVLSVPTGSMLSRKIYLTFQFDFDIIKKYCITLYLQHMTKTVISLKQQHTVTM